jgi:hypothetical protein
MFETIVSVSGSSAGAFQKYGTSQEATESGISEISCRKYSAAFSIASRQAQP